MFIIYRDMVLKLISIYFGNPSNSLEFGHKRQVTKKTRSFRVIVKKSMYRDMALNLISIYFKNHFILGNNGGKTTEEFIIRRA